MPAPVARDLEVTAARLGSWLQKRLDDAHGVRIEVSFAAGAGFVNETMLLDATWRQGGKDRQEAYVLRVRPSEFTVLFEAPEFFSSQVRLMERLGSRGLVPVPPVRWFEEDSSWLGAPFMVMDRVAGATQPDVPPYNHGGWLHDATKEQQQRLWWSAVETLARINTVDWRAEGLDFLFDDTRGPRGLDQRLSYYDAALEWAGGAAPGSVLAHARTWLHDHRPADEEQLALSWGDARLGNLIFGDFEVTSIIDWEVASIGPPLQDLGWWMFLDRAWFGDVHSGDPSDPLGLPGFPCRDQTLARWAELTGFSPANFAYYEAFGGYRTAVGIQRLGTLMAECEVIPADSQWPVNNMATQALAPLIGVEHPVPVPLPVALGGPA
jgi:aminoglycoside phosphotransferase (APT) family kinase protein